jgi:glycosyltransferase involved in cell wall biosynthesis
MTPISAVIITFNEERNIKNCIESLIPVMDEIIIIDSFSTDLTKEICLTYPVVYMEKSWQGYSDAKNFGNSMAKHEFIFSIDADERLSEDLQNELILLKSQKIKGNYSVNRLTNYCNHWVHYSGWFPDWKTRLFSKEISTWNDEIVHEDLVHSSGIETKKLNGLLHHYSYYSYKQHKEKADNYSLLTAKKYFTQKKKVTFLSPYLSAISRFISMYLWKRGFLDGYSGFMIAKISAQSNIVKYNELLRLYREKRNVN